MKLEKNARNIYSCLCQVPVPLVEAMWSYRWWERNFVEDLHWIEEGDDGSGGYRPILPLSNQYRRQCPISIVYRCAGIPGQSLQSGTVPSACDLTVISYCYEAFIQIRWIQVMLFGNAGRWLASHLWCGMDGSEVWSQPQKVYAHHAGSLCMQCFVWCQSAYYHNRAEHWAIWLSVR